MASWQLPRSDSRQLANDSFQGTSAIVGPPFASRAEQGRLPLEDAAPRPVWKLVRAAKAQGDGLRLCLDTAQELTQHLQVFFRFLGVGHVRAVLE